MAWYWHLLIACCLPGIGYLFMIIWVNLVIDNWWTPMIVLWISFITGIIYILIVIGALLGNHLVIL